MLKLLNYFHDAHPRVFAHDVDNLSGKVTIAWGSTCIVMEIIVVIRVKNDCVGMVKKCVTDPPCTRSLGRTDQCLSQRSTSTIPQWEHHWN